MARLEVTIDATEFIKAIREVQADTFVAVADYYGAFEGLESELNINQIDLPDA